MSSELLGVLCGELKFREKDNKEEYTLTGSECGLAILCDVEVAVVPGQRIEAIVFNSLEGLWGIRLRVRGLEEEEVVQKIRGSWKFVSEREMLKVPDFPFVDIRARL